MTDSNFAIVYEKLEEALAESNLQMKDLPHAEADHQEIDEIDELRRMVLEVSEPDQTSFTMA